MTAPATRAPEQDPQAARRRSFVTATIAGQLFGIPIERAHDVFNVTTVTPVPLAPPDILGLMNLRGRVITALDIRQRLGFPRASTPAGTMAIGIEAQGDAFGLVVDQIGEIVVVDSDALDENPVHLDPAWAELSGGLYRLDGELLVVLDLDAMLEAAPAATDNPRLLEPPQ